MRTQRLLQFPRRVDENHTATVQTLWHILGQGQQFNRQRLGAERAHRYVQFIDRPARLDWIPNQKLSIAPTGSAARNACAT